MFLFQFVLGSGQEHWERDCFGRECVCAGSDGSAITYSLDRLFVDKST